MTAANDGGGGFLQVLFIGLVLLLFWTWSKKHTGVMLNELANAGF